MSATELYSTALQLEFRTQPKILEGRERQDQNAQVGKVPIAYRVTTPSFMNEKTGSEKLMAFPQATLHRACEGQDQIPDHGSEDLESYITAHMR